jgi:hypothetical protein
MKKLTRRNIRNHEYVGPVVFKVLDRDELGRPSKLQIGYDDSVFSLEQGAEFFTGWVHAESVEPRLKGSA